MTGLPNRAQAAAPARIRPKVLTVVIVSYNTRDLLARCLENVLAAARGLAADFVVVDNASADGSAALVAERFPAVRLIRNADNRGFAAASNQGIRASRSEFVLLLNSDAFVDQAALGTMINFLRRHPRAGVCGAQLLGRDGRVQPPPVHFPTPLSGLFSATALGRIFPRSRHNIRPPAGPVARDRPRRVDWVSGACFMVRRRALAEVGLLDEGYFLYFEETDWCRRMTENGWEVWYLPAARVRHVGGGSVDASVTAAPFQTYHPRHMLASRRRHMRKFYGTTGMLVTEILDLALYAVQLLKHGLGPGPRSRARARDALTAIGIILGLKKVG